MVQVNHYWQLANKVKNRMIDNKDSQICHLPWLQRMNTSLSSSCHTSLYFLFTISSLREGESHSEKE